jgi:hypothetical protein
VVSAASQDDQLRFALPAQAGDYCLLLVPTQVMELQVIQTRQKALQSCYGGIATNPVHLTCQRFRLDEAEKVRAVLRQLEPALRSFHAQPLIAEKLIALRSDFRGQDVLKWIVRKNETVRWLIEAMETAIEDNGGILCYARGEPSTWITTLEGINLTCDDSTYPNGLPYTLFTPGALRLTRIWSGNQFETVENMELAD